MYQLKQIILLLDHIRMKFRHEEIRNRILPEHPAEHNKILFKNIVHKSKELYSYLNVFELQMSRFYKDTIFRALVHELDSFNNELKTWKEGSLQIKNVVMTYSLYQNLFSRLRYLSNFSRKPQEALKGIKEISSWFYKEKPKIRGQVKRIKGQLKQYQQYPIETGIKDFFRSHSQKKQTELYLNIQKVSTNELFPVKEKLKLYQRKTILPSETVQKNGIPDKASSLTTLGKAKLSQFRNTMSTMIGSSSPGFKQTQEQFKFLNPLKQKIETEKSELQTNNIDTEIKESEIKEQLEAIEREKKAHFQDIIQDKIIRYIPEDQKPDHVDFVKEELKKKKAFSSRENPQLQNAEQSRKQTQQSSLRRVMNINQNTIRSKLEDLNIKRNLALWGKAKSKRETNHIKGMDLRKAGSSISILRKIDLKNRQQLEKGKYNSSTKIVNFSCVTFKQVIKSPKKVSQVQSPKKKSNPIKQGQKKKITKNKTLSPSHEIENQSFQDKMPKKPSKTENLKLKSLTMYSSQPKRDKFQQFLKTHDQKFHEEARMNIQRIKTTFSRNSLSIDHKTISKGLLSVPSTEDFAIPNRYSLSGRSLPSNPFFPKQRPKKKKGKK